nr:replication protein A 70 kDa DNA-binding subunit D [Tanacetum cinerariifolium]
MDDQCEGCFSMETILRQQQSTVLASVDMIFLTYVISRLINNKDITVLNGKMGVKKSSLEFELQDLKGDKIHCILWNNLAEKLHKYIKENENSQEPIIILIIMTKCDTCF